MAAIARSKVLHLLNKEMYDGTGIPMTSDGDLYHTNFLVIRIRISDTNPEKLHGSGPAIMSIVIKGKSEPKT